MKTIFAPEDLNEAEMQSLAAELLGLLPVGSKAKDLPAPTTNGIQTRYIGPVRIIRAYDPVLDKTFVRGDIDWE